MIRSDINLVVSAALAMSFPVEVAAQQSSSQTPKPAEPSQEALALAKVIQFNQFGPIRIGAVEEEVRNFERELFYTSFASRKFQPPCDKENPTCRAIANEISEEAGREVQARKQAWINRIYARIFDLRMSKSEIQQVHDFAIGMTGQKFFDSIKIDFYRPELVALLNQESSSYQIDMKETKMRYFDRFYRNIEGLPKAAMRIPPPPPPPLAPRSEK